MLIPTAPNAGVRTVSYGLLDALIHKNVRVCALSEIDTDIVVDSLLDNIFGQYKIAAPDKDIVIINGISLFKPYAAELNFAIEHLLFAAKQFH